MNIRLKKIMCIVTIILIVICFATVNCINLLSGNLIWVLDFICVVLILLLLYSFVCLEK